MDVNPFEIRGLFIEECNFSANVKGKKVHDFLAQTKIGKMAVISLSALDVSIELGKNKKEEEKYFCRLNVETKKKMEPDLPCHFKIVGVGFFKLKPSFQQEMHAVGPKELSRFLTVHLPTLVYSSMREFLITVTGRSPLQAIVLPVYLFPGRDLDLEK